MKEYHIAVPRTARYVTLGDPAAASHAWFALHGYGQLASTFASYLATLDTGNRLVVVPEGLSRFYLDSGRGAIGASWMTKEDREHEIADYVGYLDQVYHEAVGRVSGHPRCYLLGFSQGVATATRWLARGTARFDGFCAWAGTLAPEVSLDGPHRALAGRRIAVVAGHRDEYLTSDWLALESRRLDAAGGKVRQFPFHGGHRMDRTVLAEVAAFFETPEGPPPAG